MAANRRFLKNGIKGKSTSYIAHCPLRRCPLFGVSAKSGFTVLCDNECESYSRWKCSAYYGIITNDFIRASVDALCRDETDQISRDPHT